MASFGLAPPAHYLPSSKILIEIAVLCNPHPSPSYCMHDNFKPLITITFSNTDTKQGCAA